MRELTIVGQAPSMTNGAGFPFEGPSGRHLFLGTQLDNVRDCMTKGRKTAPPVRRGLANNKTKLRPEHLEEIRRTLGVESDAIIADRYGVRRSSIRRIRMGLGIEAARGRARGVGNSKLTRSDAEAIRKAWPRVPVRVLARQYGVSVHAIYGVVNGRTWQ
jgi:hypothetical protein